MSRQKVLHITIPPYGGDPEGVEKAIRDEALLDLGAIKELVEYERFSSCETLYPKHAGHHGPVQHPSMFSDDYFKRQAFNHLQRAEVVVADHPEWTGKKMLNEVGPILVRVGLSLAELNMRDSHYEDVDRGSRLVARLKKQASEQKGKRGDRLRRTYDFMKLKVSEGHSITNAARIASRNGYGDKTETNRKLYYRYLEKL